MSINPNYSNPEYSTPRNVVIRLPSKYGAVAISDDSKLTSSVSAESKRKAQNEALNKCKQGGGIGCKIAFSIRNGCISIAQGYYGNGMSKIFFDSADNKGEVENLVLQQCHEYGGFKKCSILLPEECSLPTPPN